MKLHHSLLTTLILSCCLFACSNNDNDPQEEEEKRITTNEIYFANRFAKDALSSVYLWNKEIKTGLDKLNANTNQDPIGTVKEIRYKENGKEVDKWTVLTADAESMNSSMQGVSTTYGYEVMLGQFSNTKTYFFLVSLVYANSPAEKAGIKRGDIIMQLDGKDITDDNYLDIYYTSNITLGMGVYSKQGISRGENISLKAINMYCNPILANKIFEFNGKKVAYLAYSSFDVESATKLVDICRNYKTAGVSELILDLRYNGGGYVFTENVMASMFAPFDAVKSNAVYQTEIWNDEYMQYYKSKGEDLNTYFSTNHSITINGKKTTLNTSDANIGLKKIYALISSGTASASESLLIGLMPYMDIITLGNNSHGKYCTGIVATPDILYEKAPDVIKKWGIYVMINRYADKNGKNPCMPDGLIPTQTVKDDPMDGYQLGDERETMLREALIKAGKKDIPTASTRTLLMPNYHTKYIQPNNPLFGKRILNEGEMKKLPKLY
ncbi:MAG: PDZ domain-containing protein [Mediterranea massiliensis]|nr:PDZ domain-containing protein [Mediterranea massiliensis]